MEYLDNLENRVDSQEYEIEMLVIEQDKLEKRNEELEAEMEKIVAQRDYWEEKATELANDIGDALGFEVGEHSNINCPVGSYRRCLPHASED